MNEIKDGGSAFPIDCSHGKFQPGMTLRDWFAGQAMNALLSDSERQIEWSQVSFGAYEMADAMIRQREKAHASK